MPKVTLPIEEQVNQYNELRNQAKTIENQMKKLSESIKDYASKNGVKDDKGSFFCENDSFIYGKQARKSIKFNEDTAISFFMNKGLFDAVKTVQIVNEPAVEKYVGEGKLSFKDLESITETTITYAITVEPKKKIEEVQESEVYLPAVASNKPKLPKITKRK